LDNQCSKAVKKYIKSENVTIQLVEPYNHRVNAAEPAVKTAKYHMISCLATVDINCPLQLWDKFCPQIQDSLNMLRTSRRNPAISAYEELNGAFDYNKTPMDIIGTRGIIFNDAETRASFENHGEDFFYVGMAKYHYRLIFFFCDTYTLLSHHTISKALSNTLQSTNDITERSHLNCSERFTQRDEGTSTHSGIHD
jgi:hypothetical protein